MSQTFIRSNLEAYNCNKKFLKEAQEFWKPFFDSTSIKSFRCGEFVNPQEFRYFSSHEEAARYAFLEENTNGSLFQEAVEDVLKKARRISYGPLP